jgi:hypothetical protein
VALPGLCSLTGVEAILGREHAFLERAFLAVFHFSTPRLALATLKFSVFCGFPSIVPGRIGCDIHQQIGERQRGIVATFDLSGGSGPPENISKKENSCNHFHERPLPPCS